ncbi:MAG TPA: phage tail protein [Flavobacteriales bacterium]|nr:phage tail protein [Flavobacteriales bacterium]
MYAQIGDIILSNEYGFSGFSDERGVTIVEQALIDRKPSLQRTGEELIKINFSLVLHRTFINIEEEVAKFEKYVTDSTPVPITLGTGIFIGNFILSKIKKTVDKTLSDGTIFECTVEISAIEFPLEVTTNTGTAIATNNPPALASVTVQPSLAGKIGTEIRETQTLSAGMNDDLRTAQAQPEKRAAKMKQTLLKIQQVEKKLVNVYEISSNAFRLANEAQSLRTRIIRAQKDLAKLKSFCQVNDVESAMQANRDFQSNMSNVGGFTAPFTKSYILRRTV